MSFNYRPIYDILTHGTTSVEYPTEFARPFGWVEIAPPTDAKPYTWSTNKKWEYAGEGVESKFEDKVVLPSTKLEPLLKIIRYLEENQDALSDQEVQELADLLNSYKDFNPVQPPLSNETQQLLQYINDV